MNKLFIYLSLLVFACCVRADDRPDIILKPEKKTPQIGNRSLSISAKVKHPNPHGVVLAQGGNAFGYSLYFDRGLPAFAWRNRSQLTTLKAKEKVSGEVLIQAEVEEGRIRLFANGKEVASAKIKGFLAEQPGLGLFIGGDGVHAVGYYKVPNRFNGMLISHQIRTGLPPVSMRTPWGEKLDTTKTWREYPRPLLQRKQWTNLNGPWEYAITEIDQTDPPGKWDGKITVPFAVEAPLSGVEKRFTPEDALWYRREIAIEKQDDKRYLLNFEAVDYRSTLWINDAKIGTHVGGNLPFSFDITEAIQSGKNRILLKATDATDSAYQLHGKQRLEPRGIWYTPVSGIWQTVWMEEVPANRYIKHLETKPGTDGKVRIGIHTSSHGEQVKDSVISVRILLGEREVARGDYASANKEVEFVELSVPDPKLWEPGDPVLYDLEITMGPDTVHSYFGIRETGIEKDQDGHLRFTLNKKPIFHWGTLDQGWWPDGLLTPPSEAAMVSDIQFLKDAGFNTIRKHIKVEPRRYYYHCDKLGMMVWQDQVSAKRLDDPKWTRLKPNPETLSWPKEAHAQYMIELERMIYILGDHPSIVQWVPFNERWGQHQTMEVGKWLMARETMRPINIASGGNFFSHRTHRRCSQLSRPRFPVGRRSGRSIQEFCKGDWRIRGPRFSGGGTSLEQNHLATGATEGCPRTRPSGWIVIALPFANLSN